MNHLIIEYLIHKAESRLASARRLSRYQQFKDFQRRILVATNLFGRGMDIERVNIVFNYDMPEDSDTYLHRVRIHVVSKWSLKWHVSHGLVPFSGGSCGSLRHQGFGRHICVRRDWRKDPERRAGPIRGQRVWVTRGDWHFHLQWVLGLILCLLSILSMKTNCGNLLPNLMQSDECEFNNSSVGGC